MCLNFLRILMLISLFFVVGYAYKGTTMFTRRGVSPLKLITVRTRLNKKVSPANFKIPLKRVSGAIASTKMNVSDRFPRDSDILPFPALNRTEVLQVKAEDRQDSERKRPLFRNGNRQRQQRQRCRPKFANEPKLWINETRLNETETRNEDDQSSSKEDPDEPLRGKNETGKIIVRVGGIAEASLPVKEAKLNETEMKNETAVRDKPDENLKTKNETNKIVVRVGKVVESSLPIKNGESDNKLRFLGSDDVKNKTEGKDEKVKVGIKEAQNGSKSDPIVKNDKLKDGENKEEFGQKEFPVEANKLRNMTEEVGNENGVGKKMKANLPLSNFSDTTISYKDDLDYSLGS